MECPICSQVINGPLRLMRVHLSRKHLGLSEIKKVSLLLGFTQTTWEEVLENYTKGVSEFELSKKHHISFTAALKEAGLRRTHSETKKLPVYQHKYSETIKNRYGVSNISQIAEIKRRKEATYLEHYGVKHNWQIPSVREKATRNTDQCNAIQQRQAGIEKKYGVKNVSQVPWIKTKQIQTRQQALDKMSLEARQRMTLKARKSISWISRPQQRVNELFASRNYSFIINCPLFGFNYDLVFKEEKIIIEVNGTYWHGDPRKYKASDLIYGKEAHQIWEKDNRKRQVAETNGYAVLVLWESDLTSLSDGDILDLWRKHASQNFKN